MKLCPIGLQTSTLMNTNQNPSLRNYNSQSFKCTPTIRIDLLKKNLSSICEETINHFDNHNIAVGQNLFTKSFVHHSLEFAPQKGNNYHNIKDPFHTTEWLNYLSFRNRPTSNGQTLKEFYAKKMRDSIKTWNEKFLEIIEREKTEGKNNVLDQLLNSSSDVQKIKQILGISY